MKIQSHERDDLRRGLREHAYVGQHFAKLETIERMTSRALLSLAEKLGVDPKAVIKDAQARRAARQEYSLKFPAFEGSFNFDLSIELLGKRVTRKVRVTYEHTPEWEYFDLWKEAPHLGSPMASLGVKYRTVASKDGTWGGPFWEALGILDIGEVWTVIDDEIEERCKVEDVKRRRAAARKARKPGVNGSQTTRSPASR